MALITGAVDAYAGKQLVLPSSLNRLFRVDFRQLIKVLLHPLPPVVFNGLLDVVLVLLNLQRFLLLIALFLHVLQLVRVVNLLVAVKAFAGRKGQAAVAVSKRNLLLLVKIHALRIFAPVVFVVAFV